MIDSEWSPELLVDKVDIYRGSTASGPMGTARPASSPTEVDMACLIKYLGRPEAEDLSLAGIQANVLVKFAQDLDLRTNEVLVDKATQRRFTVRAFNLKSIQRIWHAYCQWGT
jgi:hypothetical protein